MMLVDTNVVSEPLRPAPDMRVVQWLDAQAADTLFISSVSVAELLVGVARLPQGKRKHALADGLQSLLETLFAGRILPFDQHDAVHHAQRVAHAGRNGHSVSMADAQIAAIASRHGMRVVTRDTAPILAMGLEVLNPWHAP